MIQNSGVFWIAFLASAIGAYPIYRMLLAMKSRQTVSQYAPESHAQKQGTPTMGGLIIVFGAAIAMLVPVAKPSEWTFYTPYASIQPSEPVGISSERIALVLLFLAFALIGFIDDFVVPRLFVGKRGLGWKQKILMQIVAAAAFAAFTASGHWVQFAVTVFCILFFSNAYNFADGLDALAGSLLIFLAGGLAAICMVLRADELGGICVALIGAVIPFLYLNAPKAKLFMGDVGSLPIGSVLGVVVASLACATPAHVGELDFPARYHYFYGSPGDPSVSTRLILALVVISLMMVVELVPVPLQILSVKLRKGKRLFPYTPIHHAFEKAGWPETRVVWHFALTQLLLSILAVTILGASVWQRG
jgi:phospho-N-acetylmuramoyl-pentapeptide-transferase